MPSGSRAYPRWLARCSRGARSGLRLQLRESRSAPYLRRDGTSSVTTSRSGSQQGVWAGLLDCGRAWITWCIVSARGIAQRGRQLVTLHPQSTAHGECALTSFGHTIPRDGTDRRDCGRGAAVARAAHPRCWVRSRPAPGVAQWLPNRDKIDTDIREQLSLSSTAGKRRCASSRAVAPPRRIDRCGAGSCGASACPTHAARRSGGDKSCPGPRLPRGSELNRRCHPGVAGKSRHRLHCVAPAVSRKEFTEPLPSHAVKVEDTYGPIRVEPLSGV